MMPIPKKPIRGHIIKIRVNDKELAAIQARAGESATAEWLRNLAMGFPLDSMKRPTRHRARITQASNPERSMLIREIARIGSNLNQVARAVNSCRSSRAPIDLLLVAAQLAAIWEELKRVQQNFQARKGTSCGDRLSSVADGCSEENPNATRSIDAGRPSSDKGNYQ